MEFKDGASIYTSDGKEAGRLHRVVIEPDTKEVTHIVIQKGLLFKDDKVIPIVNVASTSEEKVSLSCTTDDLKKMSPLMIKQKEPVSEAFERGQSYDPLAGGMVANPIQERTISKRTIPEELVALKEGAQVRSDDDEHVGHIECVKTDPETGFVSHLIVSQGLLSKNKITVPIWWVKLLDDDEVHLAVEAQELEALGTEKD
jgi:sporulation protein YlmC with PRC-barrel domain